MLLNIDTMKEITNIPHRKSFEAWKKNISEIDYRAIIDELNKRIDDNQEIHTAGWMPGHDWTGTVFYPIYLACKKDKSAAALFFGIILSFQFQGWQLRPASKCKSLARLNHSSKACRLSDLRTRKSHSCLAILGPYLIRQR